MGKIIRILDMVGKTRIILKKEGKRGRKKEL